MIEEKLSPAETDRLAVQAEFFRNIEKYTMEDATGNAPRHIQVKLRDKLNLKAWSVAIEACTAKTTNPEIRRMLRLKRLECSDLRMAEARIERMMKQRAMQDRGAEGQQYFQEMMAMRGWEFPAGVSTKEIACILLAEIESHLRAK